MEDSPLETASDSLQRSVVHDDTQCAAAIGALAFISTTLAHEALGHGSICLALGGRALLHPVSMQCTAASPMLVAAGPLTNLAIGAVLWIVLKRSPPASVHVRYFLWVAMAFHLFNWAGYLGLGAVTGFGDWGVLLSAVGTWWRAGLALLAALFYYGCMHAVASAGSVFLGRNSSGAARGRRLTLAPYVAAGVVACAAALLSPLGRSYVWVAAAASFGAGLGLLAIHDWGGACGQPESGPPLARSFGWIAGAAIIGSLFVFVVGRGLTMAL